MNNQKRKVYLIDKDFQLKYTFYPVFLMVCVSFLVAIAIYLSAWFSIIKEFSATKLQQNLSTIVRVREYQGVRTNTTAETLPIFNEETKMLSNYQISLLNKILYTSTLKFLPILFVLLLIVLVFGIHITHRIAGPVYRLEKELDKTLSGETQINLNFRRTDEFQNVAKKISTLVNNYINMKKKIEETISQLEATTLTPQQSDILKTIKNVLTNYK